MANEKLKYTIRVNYAPPTSNYTVSRREHKKKWNVKNILAIIGNAVSIMIIAWIFCSWINIICNNTSTFNYAWWNVFRLFTNI